jgi:prepilin-type N-terminal cleavage/methylation domain-containing protein
LAEYFNVVSSGEALKTLKNIFHRDGGFTLTELAVAMVVVGILSGIAVPNFLAARNNSYDKEAQSSINTALLAAELHYSQYGDFSDSLTATCSGSGALAADLQKLVPSIDLVLAATTSTGPDVVSVQANTTWNSNNESLGCQAFYATALSRSGHCWIGRTTVEGKYLLTGSLSPIIVHSEMNTANASITELSSAELNGTSYAVLKRKNSAAFGSTDATVSLAATKTACSGAIQGTGAITAGTGVVLSSEYYSSWRSVVGANAGANS